MTTEIKDTENQAGICRITCGWKKAELPLDFVRRYWRDVHSPAISRRAGLYEYRHYQFDAVIADAFDKIEGIHFNCAAHQQLMWLSDVRYRDEAALAAFGVSPDDTVKAHLLADIDLLVDQSTTYKAVGDKAVTLVDNTQTPTPQGPPKHTNYCVFFRQRGDAAAFEAKMRKLAARWAATVGVLRIRLSLFEAPDMEAEKKAGYPIKTHAPELQYQAWIDLLLNDATVAKTLLQQDDSAHIATVHVYPVAALYTSIYAGKPTLVGLRGYPAYEAINAFNAVGQREPALLEWMYGPVVHGDGQPA
jgi:hypothetical protein